MSDSGNISAVPQDVPAQTEDAMPQPEELIQDVKSYIEIQRKARISSYPAAGTEAYLIDRQWVQKWKEYVNYKKIKAQEKDLFYIPSKNPGPCTNEAIIKDQKNILWDKEDENDYRNKNLADNQRQNIEFKIVGKDVWNLFFKVYGGNPFLRYYRSQSQYSSFTQYRILFLPSYEKFDAENISEEHFLYMAKTDKLSDLKSRLAKLMKQHDIMNVQSDSESQFEGDKSIRIHMMDFRESRKSLIKWAQQEKIASLKIQPDDDKYQLNTGVNFLGECQEHFLDQSLDNVQVSVHDFLVVELAKKSQFIFKFEKDVQVWHGKCEYCYKQNVLRVQCACKMVRYCNANCMKNDERFHTDKCTAQLQVDTKELRFKKSSESAMGLCGLQNLGNTCFMNSSLQCLSNIWPLTKYFLESKFLHELNESNVLGTEGKLVKQYALFLAALWYEDKKVFSPWNLKKIIGKYQPMFSGFAQHDSQELLNFVLDALHEDLNRVKKKPYVENPDSNGRSDEEVSSESWQNHLRRNQSVFVDLMHGQYKSTLNCPVCQKTSITFDPFMSLQLPIPTNEAVLLNFYFVFYDMTQTPLSCSVQIQTEDSIVSIRKKIAQLLNLDPFSFVIAQISDNEIKKLVNRNHTYDMFKKAYNVHYFAMEVNPDVFNNQRDQQMYQQLEDLISADEKNIGPDRSDDDFNNGINRSWVKVFIRSEIMTQVSQYYSSFQKKANTFPRLLWISKEWDLRTLHFEIFKFYKSIVVQILKEVSENNDEKISEYIEDYNLQGFEEMDDETLFKKLFKFVDGSGVGEENTLYDLRIVNHNSSLYYQPECPICHNAKCQNCVVPYSSSSVNDLFNTYYGDAPNSQSTDVGSSPDLMMNPQSEPEEEEKDNVSLKPPTSPPERLNAYFFKEKEKKYYGYGYNNSSSSRIQENLQKDLEFEVFWNYNYISEKALSKLLNKCNAQEKVQSIKEAFDARATESVTLFDCLERLRLPEQLAADNTWYCSNCKDHVQAYKKLEIYKVPPVLIISLKRFKSASGYFNEKVQDKVNFPFENLDMSKFALKHTDGDLTYDLIGVSNHYGSMSFGHYTAFAYNHHNKAWFEYDDSSVSEVQPTKVCTEAAYNLFYQRREFFPDGNVDYDQIRNKLAPEFAEEQAKIDEELQKQMEVIKKEIGEIGETNEVVSATSQVDMQVDGARQVVETGGINYNFDDPDQDD